MHSETDRGGKTPGPIGAKPAQTNGLDEGKWLYWIKPPRSASCTSPPPIYAALVFPPNGQVAVATFNEVLNDHLGSDEIMAPVASTAAKPTCRTAPRPPSSASVEAEAGNCHLYA